LDGKEERGGCLVFLSFERRKRCADVGDEDGEGGDEKEEVAEGEAVVGSVGMNWG